MKVNYIVCGDDGLPEQDKDGEVIKYDALDEARQVAYELAADRPGERITIYGALAHYETPVGTPKLTMLSHHGAGNEEEE